MFKEWLNIFKKESLIDQAYRRSFEMIDITSNMYLKAKESLRDKEDNEVDVNIRDQDLEINRYEREVRRNVFNSLTVSGMESLSSGLVLVSIIIDIERIGDYTKNMVELAMIHPGKLKGGKFEEDLHKIEIAVENEFVLTKKCFEKGDKSLASTTLKEYFWLNKTCDAMVEGLVKEEDKSIPPGDAVTLGLYTRWLKRINSHLRNITTSVVNPFDRIGFEEKK